MSAALRELLAHCDGKDCKCMAYSRHECCCSVDWTPAEIYTLRDELQRKSAAYEALVAGCSELAAKLDRQAEENYTDRGNALSRCADDIRLLVSDDRPSHTAGENDA